MLRYAVRRWVLSVLPHRLAGLAPARGRSVETKDGTALQDDDLRELWHFRATFMDLKPAVDPETDFAAMTALVRSGSLWRLRDGDGRLLGALLTIAHVERHAGREFVHLNFEYAFFEGSNRRSFATRMAFVSAFSRLFVFARGRPIYLCTAAYPAAAASLGETFPMWLPGAEEGMTAWERGARAAIGERHPGYDPATGLVTMRTLPRERSRPPARPDALATWDAYMRLCPGWQDGIAVLIFGRIRLLQFVKSTLRYVPAMLLKEFRTRP